jgi:hypothetical protein
VANAATKKLIFIFSSYVTYIVNCFLLFFAAGREPGAKKEKQENWEESVWLRKPNSYMAGLNAV